MTCHLTVDILEHNHGHRLFIDIAVFTLDYFKIHLYDL